MERARGNLVAEKGRNDCVGAVFEMSSFYDITIEVGAGKTAPQLKACTALQRTGARFSVPGDCLPLSLQGTRHPLLDSVSTCTQLHVLTHGHIHLQS